MGPDGAFDTSSALIDTTEQIPAAPGHQLTVAPALRWKDVEIGGGRSAAVPDRLPELADRAAIRRLEMPLHLDWSRPGRAVDLSDRSQRARAYESVLREGRPEDIESIVDGALLVDLWHEVVLPRQLRRAWQPPIDDARTRHRAPAVPSTLPRRPDMSGSSLDDPSRPTPALVIHAPVGTFTAWDQAALPTPPVH
jgi:hypothetical protein